MRLTDERPEDELHGARASELLTILALVHPGDRRTAWQRRDAVPELPRRNNHLHRRRARR